MKYNFDTELNRRGSGALKYDALQERFGNSDLFPMWVADMDFAVCNEITESIIRRMQHPVYGYAQTPQSYWQSIIDWVKKHFGIITSREERKFDSLK